MPEQGNDPLLEGVVRYLDALEAEVVHLQEREAKLATFTLTCALLNEEEGLTPTQLHHVIRMAKNALADGKEGEE